MIVMDNKMGAVKIFQLLIIGYSCVVSFSQDTGYRPFGGFLDEYYGEQSKRSSNAFRSRFGPLDQYVAPDPSGDTRGKDFMFAFISNFMPPDNLKVLIGANGPGPTTISIAIPRLNYNRQKLTIQAGRHMEVDLPVAAASLGVGTQNGTVQIKSDKPITVHGINSLKNTNEGFLVIPVTGLGLEYFVASYDPVPIEKSEFLITGTVDLTRLRIEPSVGLRYNNRLFNPGDPILLNINRMQSIQFQALGDLTGTKIKADKPISVMSGCTCTLVPTQTYRCDHLVENIPPVNTWGKRFTMLPFLNRTSGYVLRVIAARSQTKVDVAGTSYTLAREGQFKEFDQIVDLPTAITSNKPVLVVQYAKGLETDNTGDPLMTIIPPVEQYITGSVTFGTFDMAGTDKVTSFMSLSITSIEFSNLRVNSRSAFSAGTGQNLGKLISYGFERSMAIPDGSNTIDNPAPGSTYAAIIYGWAKGTGYGMPAGYGLKKLLCSDTNFNTGTTNEYECNRQSGGTGNTGGGGGGGGGGGSFFPNNPSNPAAPPNSPQTDEACYSFPILLLSIIAPATVIFLVMLIITCGLMYRRTKY